MHGKPGQSSTSHDNVDLSAYQSYPSLMEELGTVKHFLRDEKTEWTRKKVYNYRIDDIDEAFIESKLDKIFEELECTAKINFSFGFVLRNTENPDEFKYFYASNNNPVLSFPVVLSNSQDLEFLKDRIDGESYFESAIRQRPNTKWRFFTITNVTFFVYLLLDIPIGCIDGTFPQQLVKNCMIQLLTKDSEGKPYNDNLCMFRAVALHKYGSLNLSFNTTKTLKTFLERIGSKCNTAENFVGIRETQIHILEDVIEANIDIYSIEYVDNVLVGSISRRSVGRHATTYSLLRYDNHICYTHDIKRVLKKFRCQSCDRFFGTSWNLQRHEKTCDDRIKHKYPKSVYALKRTIFERMEDCGIAVPETLRLCDSFAVFDFESITVPDKCMKNTEYTTWIGKHVPISVSISSTYEDEPKFFCEKDPKVLVAKFIDYLVELSTLNSEKMRLKLQSYFDQLENQYDSVLNQLPQKDDTMDSESGNTQSFIDDAADDDNDNDDDDDNPAIKHLKRQKVLLSQLRDDLADYCDTFVVFGFNSSRYDLNLIKEFLLEHLILTHQTAPKTIKKNNQFISMKFLGLQFLDILNFVGGNTSLDRFLKAYGAEESKGFFPYEWLDSFDKLGNETLPPPESFFSKLRNVNVLDSEYQEYMSLISSGNTDEQSLRKMKLRAMPKSMLENYNDLKTIWEREHMTSMLDYLRWYNNKDVVPTLVAIQRMMQFYHDQGMDMLKLGCTLPNLANTFLHKSTTDKFFPFTEGDKEYDSYIRENIVGGPSIVFNRYAKVGETFIGDTNNLCWNILGIDASQLYPFAMTKEMPTGIYVKWEKNTTNHMFHPKRNTKSYFEYLVMNYLQARNPNCTIQSTFTTGNQKMFGNFSVDGYCSHCNRVFEAMGCYFHFCKCQESKRLPIDVIEKGLKKREADTYRRDVIKSFGVEVEEIWECQWWKSVKENDNGANDFMKKFAPYQKPIPECELMRQIRCGQKFGVLDCSLRVPDNLRDKFSNFPPIFKNIDVGRDDIGDYMKEYAEQNDILKRPRRMLISSFHLKRGPIITPLLRFYLDQGLIVDEVFWFIEYTPKKSFGSFVDRVVQARREGDKNKNSTVVAETMKLIGNSAYGYQIMDRSKHTETKYVIGSHVDKIINNQFFKNMNELPYNIFEAELSKKEVVHKEPIIIGFFILQYAKLTMLELYYNFFYKYCDVNKFELIEMDTDSLYMSIADESIQDLIRPEMVNAWTSVRSNDCRDVFDADGTKNFFPRDCCSIHNNFDQRTPGLFKEEFRCTEMVALCSKTYCCHDEHSSTVKLSSKGLNKSSLINCSPMEKYLKVLNEQAQIRLINRGFRVVTSTAVYTYELMKNGLSYFYPKRKVRADGIHTDPLDI